MWQLQLKSVFNTMTLQLKKFFSLQTLITTLHHHVVVLSPWACCGITSIF